MNTRNQTSTRKCSERAVWMLSTLLIALEAGRQRRRHAQSGDERERSGDEDGDEVGDQLQAVVGHPAVFGRPVQRQVLDQHRHGVREDVPAGGHQPSPLRGREQQHVEDHAVEQPQGVDAQVPPAGEADRVTKARQPDLARQADGVLFRRPQRIGRHRFLDAEPVPARACCAGSSTAEDGREDLQPERMMKIMQEQVEEVLPSRPRPESPRSRGVATARRCRGSAR